MVVVTHLGGGRKHSNKINMLDTGSVMNVTPCVSIYMLLIMSCNRHRMYGDLSCNIVFASDLP